VRRFRGGTTAHTADESIAQNESGELAAGRSGNRGELRASDDRSQCSVEIEEDRRAVRGRRQRGDKGGGIHAQYDTAVSAARSPLPAFVGIGLVAGLFSALFGVGGGIVVVPLLVLLLGFEPRLATGTSLAAIGLTALFGVISYAILGRIEWGEAAAVGLPAVVGVLAGTWLQQRVPSRILLLLFAAFLVAIAIQLLAR
jgi:hypothetical protein